MKRLAGDHGFATAVEALGSEAREAYTSCGILSWVPQALVRDIVIEVARVLDRDPIELVRDVVEESVFDVLRGPWAVILRFAVDDASLVQRGASLFARGFDKGRLESILLTPNHVRITLVGWSTPHEMDLVSIESSIRAIGKVTGKGPHRITRRQDSAGISWDVELRMFPKNH